MFVKNNNLYLKNLVTLQVEIAKRKNYSIVDQHMSLSYEHIVDRHTVRSTPLNTSIQ